MIAGSPELVADGAHQTLTAGQGLGEAAEDALSIGRALSADWQGAASDAARDAIELIGRRTHVGGDVCADASEALLSYADELRGAQQAYAVAHAAQQQAAASEQRAVAQAALRNPDVTEHLVQQAQAEQSLAAGDMNSARQRQARANQDAAERINRLTERLSGMTTVLPSPGAAVAAGRGAAAGTASATDDSGFIDWVASTVWEQTAADLRAIGSFAQGAFAAAWEAGEGIVAIPGMIAYLASLTDPDERARAVELAKFLTTTQEGWLFTALAAAEPVTSRVADDEVAEVAGYVAGSVALGGGSLKALKMLHARFARKHGDEPFDDAVFTNELVAIFDLKVVDKLGATGKGKLGDALAVITAIERGDTVLGKQPTIKVKGPNGRTINARGDFLMQRKDGSLYILEAKLGPTAKLSQNQEQAYPLFETQGGLINGKPVGPTGVEVRRYYRRGYA